tara:strand:- start:402 stop:971 length:570 start_codon:yes stop_codon:yes gene_type:complete
MNEHQRHVKARQDILKGGTAEKRIIVSFEDPKEKKEREKQIKEDRERSNERVDALKEAKMPWFCPECNKVMKKRLDDKMYRLYNHCFDCQVKFENKLRVDGKYEEWEEQKVLNNQLSYIKDQIESIEDWKEEASKQVVAYDQIGVQDIELHKETWSQNKERVETMSKEAIEELNKIKEEVEEKLNSFAI